MSTFRSNRTPRFSQGLSLIELMVALLISSIVVLGLVTLVNAIGLANRTQDGLARLQENGRFAMQRIASDLRLVGAQHCSKGDPVASLLATGGSAYVDPPRFSQTYFNAVATASNGPGIGPAAASPVYPLSPRFMFMGHECDALNCTPLLTAADRGINRLGAVIPVMGTSADARARGADVLTMRHFTTQGVLVEAVRNWQAGAPDAELDLQNDPVVLAREGFTTMAANDPVWVSDCTNSAFIRASRLGARTIRMTGNFDNGGMVPVSASAEAVAGQGTRYDGRAFHVPTSMRTVSYYLQLKQDLKVPGRLVSALMRKVNADGAQELVEGIERFDVLYGVRNGSGNVRFLTAAQVDALGGGGVGECVGAFEPGCGWRSVTSIEVYMLVSTVDDVSPSGDDEFRYSWLNTGARNVAGTFENPQTLGTLRNGLPAGRVLRREFRSTVSLRTSNY